jgi:aromatic ring-opening dioxygenase LigB subunit
MPIIFGAILPHAPHLLQDDAQTRLPKTTVSVQHLIQALIGAKPDTLFIINAHEPVEKEVFLMNVHPDVSPDLSAFGIQKPFRSWKGNLEFSSHLRQLAQDNRFPLQMATEPVEIGTSVPLALFNDLPETVSALPIHVCGLPRKNHLEFGAFLHEEAEKSMSRVAIICSSDFSLSADRSNPELYKPEGETYNEIAFDAIQSANTANLVKLQEGIIGLASTCSFEPLLVFLASLADRAKPPTELTEETVDGLSFVTAIYPF